MLDALSELDLKDVATVLQIFLALVAIAALIAAGVILWIKIRLADTFATKSDVTTLTSRVDNLSAKVDGIEKSVADLPSAESVRQIGARVADLNTSVTALGVQLDGQDAMMSGIDRRLEMLLQNSMQGGGRP